MYELLDPEQSYNHSKIERPTVKSVLEKANAKKNCEIRKQIQKSLIFLMSKKIAALKVFFFIRTLGRPAGRTLIIAY